MGKFADRYFCYVASFGLFTRLSYATPQNVKNALGHMAYLMGGMQELSQLRATHMRITLDGGRVVEDDFAFGAICNATSLGGVLMLDPNRVDLQDGKFELLLIRAPKDLVELADCVRALQNQKYDSKHITFLSASRMEVETESPMCWSLDGEQSDSGCLATVENLHHSVRVILKG
jgi:diacylglycerol kinase family enzyme